MQDDAAVDVADRGLVASAGVASGRASFHRTWAGSTVPSADGPAGEVGEQVVARTLEPPGGEEPSRPGGGRRPGRS